jgi:hypothetical protein
MLELPDRERLAAWRLYENPCRVDAPIRAERIGDHRRAYLDYEGEITGGRGRVRRLDRGEARLLTPFSETDARFELRGATLRGEFCVRAAGGGLIFGRLETTRETAREGLK